MEKVAESNTVQLWLTPERISEIEHERQREEYEREQIATAQSEQQWDEACKKSPPR